MKIILLLLFLSSACSKQIRTIPRVASPTPVASEYLVIQENNLVEYSSQNIRIAEISDGTLSYTIGLMNNYQKDKTGNDRLGNHPETEFKIQTARYKIVPVGDKVRLEFIISSCLDSSRNPFDGIIPEAEITLTQLQDQLNLNTSPSETEVLYKADPVVVSQLWETNISRTLCGDETND